MKLVDYCDKKIKVILVGEEVLIGKCLGYTKAVDNDPEIDSIDLKVKDKVYEIYQNEIKDIEII